MKSRYYLVIAIVPVFIATLAKGGSELARERWRDRMHEAAVDPYDREICDWRVYERFSVAWVSRGKFELELYGSDDALSRYASMNRAITACENAALEQMEVAEIFKRAHSAKLRAAAAAIVPLNCATLAPWSPFDRTIAIAAVTPMFDNAEAALARVWSICREVN